MPEPGHRLAARAGNLHVRHGYTMANLDDLAMRAICAAKWKLAVSFGERYDLALAAIVEHLYASGEPPGDDALIYEGKMAIRRHVDDEFRTHGIDAKNLYEGRQEAMVTMPHFRVFWWDQSQHCPSPEDRVVESLALRQIWARLGWRHRRILTAFAVHGDYQGAASALGLTMTSFRTELWSARRQFLRLWHEGERPSGIWGRASRIDAGSRNRSVTAVTIRRRKQRKARAAGTAGSLSGGRCELAEGGG